MSCVQCWHSKRLQMPGLLPAMLPVQAYPPAAGGKNRLQVSEAVTAPASLVLHGRTAWPGMHAVQPECTPTWAVAGGDAEEEGEGRATQLAKGERDGQAVARHRPAEHDESLHGACNTCGWVGGWVACVRACWLLSSRAGCSAPGTA